MIGHDGAMDGEQPIPERANGPQVPDERWVTFDESEGTRWVADVGFLSSPWTCIWGRGCQSIDGPAAAHLQHGCCSVGAELTDESEILNLAAHALCIPDGLWQHRDTAAASPSGFYRDDEHSNTAVVDGACIFLNRPGFAGGAGCALHLGALAMGESYVDWKPNVCWQVPVRIDEQRDDEGRTVLTLRRWTTEDWGDTPAAWWCTEVPEAFVGDRPMVQAMAEELVELCGPEAAARLTNLSRARAAPEPS